MDLILIFEVHSILNPGGQKKKNILSNKKYFGRRRLCADQTTLYYLLNSLSPLRRRRENQNSWDSLRGHERLRGKTRFTIPPTYTLLRVKLIFISVYDINYCLRSLRVELQFLFLLLFLLFLLLIFNFFFIRFIILLLLSGLFDLIILRQLNVNDLGLGVDTK